VSFLFSSFLLFLYFSLFLLFFSSSMFSIYLFIFLLFFFFSYLSFFSSLPLSFFPILLLVIGKCFHNSQGIMLRKTFFVQQIVANYSTMKANVGFHGKTH
jgi:hypothetical protein